jgi:hypothetical protein
VVGIHALDDDPSEVGDAVVIAVRRGGDGAGPGEPAAGEALARGLAGGGHRHQLGGSVAAAAHRW